MLKSITVQTFIPENRKILLELELPLDTHTGATEIMVVFPTQVQVEPVKSEIDDETWAMLLDLPNVASFSGPSDLADRHDDYLYGEL